MPCWAALKAPLPSCLQARAARLRLPLQVIALALFAVVSVYALVLVGPEMDPNLGILRWLFAALVVVGLLASLVVGKTSGDDLKGVSGPVRVHDRARGASGLLHVPRARERHGRFRGAGHHFGPTPHRRSCRSPG